MKTQTLLSELRKRVNERLAGVPLEEPVTEEQLQALRERNAARRAEAIARLGEQWLLSRPGR